MRWREMSRVEKRCQRVCGGELGYRRIHIGLGLFCVCFERWRFTKRYHLHMDRSEGSRKEGVFSCLCFSNAQTSCLEGYLMPSGVFSAISSDNLSADGSYISSFIMSTKGLLVYPGFLLLASSFPSLHIPKRCSTWTFNCGAVVPFVEELFSIPCFCFLHVHTSRGLRSLYLLLDLRRGCSGLQLLNPNGVVGCYAVCEKRSFRIGFHLSTMYCT